MKSKSIISIFFLITTSILLSNCKKMIEVASPQNQLTTDKVFADSTSATAAMINVYALFDKTIDVNYNKFIGLYSDELNYTGPTESTLEYVQSAVSPINATNLNFWKNSYFAIYGCNSVIEQVQKSSALSSSTTADFINEAKFLRAYTYFFLVNTYGSVPLVLQTDVNNTATIKNSDSVTVYKQILQDLKDAQRGLSLGYRGGEPVRANKYAASALLARVYLWQKDWLNAEASATTVIQSGLYTPLPAIGSVFVSDSQETILSFWTQFGYTSDAPSLIPSSGAPGYFYTTAQLNAFEAGDLRKSSWLKTEIVGSTTYYSPYKYHNRTTNTSAPEYLIALRASEQYLIRAEARAQQGNISGPSGALADLNVIRNRAGLNNYNGAIDKGSVVTAIMHERRVELFSEWGNRFLDLKRSGALNTVLSSFKSTWKSTANQLPIPQSEINTDPNLTQNPAY